MTGSKNFRLFFGLTLVVAIGNLFIMNDLATIWEGAETQFVWESLFGQELFQLPQRTAAWVAGGELVPFLLRLPGLCLFLGSVAAFYFLSRPLFGDRTSVYAILVLSASFLLPNLAKVATGDSWIAFFQLLAGLTLLRFLKQPQSRWQWLFYFLLTVGIWIQPLSTLLYTLVFAQLLYSLHPQGKRLWRLQPWGAALVLTVILQLAGLLSWSGDTFYFYFRPLRYSLLMIVGMAPFFGFLLAGLRDSFSKARRGEEFARINGAWILAALIAQSLVLQVVFALIIAKQLQLYFDRNYPYRGLVKTGSVLHLVAVFMLATGLMMGGFAQFGGVGFRSGLAMGGAYWIFSFVGVIGLFGLNRRYVLLGVIWSGLTALSLFWLQVYPLWEGKRQWPGEAAEKAEALRTSSEENILVFSENTPSRLELYTRARLGAVTVHSDPEVFGKTSADSIGRVFIAPDTLVLKGSTFADSSKVEGWSDPFRPVTYLIYK